MELRQLAYFLAIADAASMSEASRTLHVSQPALSAALKDLETELGFPLFDRIGKRLSINEDGRYFAERARSAFAILNDAQTTVRAGIEQRRSTVNCLVNLPLGRMGKLLFGSFHRAHPDVSLRVSFKNSDLFADKRSAIDLEILGEHEQLPANDRLLPIGYERYVAALPLDHPLAANETVSLRDLKHDGIILGERSTMRIVVDAMFDEVGFAPHVVGELQLYSDILQFVRAGIGYAIAPELTWFEDEEHELVVRPFDDVQRGRFIYARVPEDREPSPATWTLLEHLRSIVSEGSIVDPPRCTPPHAVKRAL